jgi:FKBP-type peptidyl-prolyl cis-trans isomerase FkpA
MKKVIFNPLTIVLMVAFTSLACSSKYPGFDKAESGLYYKLYSVSKDTTKPQTGFWVSLNMSYTAKVKGVDTVLFDSKKQLNGEPVRFQLPPSDFKGDLYEGIRMLSKGDSAVFIINADSLFLKTFTLSQRPAMIDSNSVLYFYVHLISVDSPAKMKSDEAIALKKYIEDNKVMTPPTASGIYIIESAAGQGIKIDSGCMVKLHFAVSTTDGKQIFSSMDRPEPLKFQFGQKFDTPGLEEAVATMKKGSKVKVIVPSNMAFGEMGRGNIVPPYATLIYDVEIVDIQTKADYEKEQSDLKKKEAQKQETAKKDESMLRQKYLQDHNITVKPTASGLYYIEKAKGTGAQAAPGKKVKVHYTGTLLNGTKFDSSRDKNEPWEFTLGKSQAIQGFDEGFSMMKKGGKAIFIIPSSIAYGERDMGEKIPPYSTLVFDVELIDVQDAAPPAAPVKK